MDLSTGPGVPASGTDPSHTRYTAGRTHGSSLSARKEVSDIQPPDTVQQLASTETSKMEVPAFHIGRPSKSSVAHSTTESAKTSVTEDSDRRPSARRQWVRSIAALDRGAGYPGRVPDGSAGGESLQWHLQRGAGN